MNMDMEDLLQESIDQLGRGERVPAGLAGRVVRRHRQRRITVRTAMVTGTAAVAVTAVLAATAVSGRVPQHAGGGLPAQTTAYVISRTERGLGAAEREGLIQEIDTQAHDAWFLVATRLCHRGEPARDCVGPMAQNNLVASDALIWTYRGQLRQEGFSADGKLVFDASSSTTVTSPGQGTVTGSVIDYPARTWWHGVARTSVAITGRCSPLPAPDGSVVNWPAAIRAALSCGLTYHLAGHQRIGNVNAIKLTGNPGPAETLWINPATYLPIRIAWQWPAGPGHDIGTLVGNFRWLKPTKANLATLKVRAPSGFRMVPPAGLAEPFFAAQLEASIPPPATGPTPTGTITPG
jgi:hypothetical protein